MPTGIPNILSDADQDESTRMRYLIMPLYQGKGWLKFIGVLMIAYGVLACLTGIGALLGWIPIWLGVMLYQSGKSIEQAVSTGDKQMALDSLNKLGTFFMMKGIMIAIGFGLSIVVSIVAIILAATGYNF